MAMVRVECGDRARILHANRCRTGGIAGFFAKETYEVVVDLNDLGTDTVDACDPFDNNVERGDALEQLMAVADLADGLEDNLLAAAYRPSMARDGDPTAFSTIFARARADIQPVRVRALPQPDAAVGLLSSLAVTAYAGSASAADLVDLGFPAAWLGQWPQEQVMLHTLLGHIVTPPPIASGPGAVVAFIGPLHLALPTAVIASASLQLAPGSLVVVSTNGTAGSSDEHTVISNIGELTERRSRWHNQAGPVVVVVDIDLTRRDRVWGRHALNALCATSRWGVVEANRKPDDIREWAADIGGLDALAVVGIEDTRSPASILATGIAVSRVDGRVATAALWASIIDARLSLKAGAA